MFSDDQICNTASIYRRLDQFYCHSLRIFVTVSLFFDYLRAGRGTSLKRRRPFAAPCRGKHPRAVSPDFGAYCCVEEVLHWIGSTYFFFSSEYRIECNRGGTRSAEKSPVQPSDLVVIHNHIMEALAKPDNEFNEDYNFWNAVPTLKAPYVKYCNASTAEFA